MAVFEGPSGRSSYRSVNLRADTPPDRDPGPSSGPPRNVQFNPPRCCPPEAFLVGTGANVGKCAPTQAACPRLRRSPWVCSDGLSVTRMEARVAHRRVNERRCIRYVIDAAD